MRGLLILLRWPISGWLHRRCLRRIARLERELGIAPPYELREIYERGESVFVKKDDELDRWSFKPGARWQVESHNHVQIFQRPTGELLKKEYLDDGSVLTTLAHRHEVERTLLFGSLDDTNHRMEA